MVMRIWRFCAALLVVVLAATPCSVSYSRKLWAKKPGSKSKLFAFERNGRVGFIDETGNLAIMGDYFLVEDFSDGLAHVTVNDKAQPFGHSAIYLDSAGKVVARAPLFLAQDFSEGLAAYEVEGKPGLRSFQPGVFLYRDYPG